MVLFLKISFSNFSLHVYKNGSLLIMTLYLATLLNCLIHSKNLSVEFFGFLVCIIILSEKNEVDFFFQMSVPCISLKKISSNGSHLQFYLARRDNTGHPCFVFYFCEELKVFEIKYEIA